MTRLLVYVHNIDAAVRIWGRGGSWVGPYTAHQSDDVNDNDSICVAWLEEIDWLASSRHGFSMLLSMDPETNHGISTPRVSHSKVLPETNGRDKGQKYECVTDFSRHYKHLAYLA